MRIIVCVKQVPQNNEVRSDPVTHTLLREGAPSTLNAADEHALEAALQLREAHGGEVTVLTLGPPQAEEALRQAVAMGADTAVLVSDRAFAGSDTLATSYALSCAIRHLGEFDLVLCGKQTFDGDTGQVGPGLAEHLGLPQATYAVGIEVEGAQVRVRRGLEGRTEVLELSLPCLVTVDKACNEPRHPGLKGVMKARKAPVETLDAAQIGADPERCGLKGSPTEVTQVFVPQRRSGGEMLEGAPGEQAAALLERLREAKLLA